MYQFGPFILYLVYSMNVGARVAQKMSSSPRALSSTPKIAIIIVTLRQALPTYVANGIDRSKSITSCSCLDIGSVSAVV
jgi:hypothetical protein